MASVAHIIRRRRARQFRHSLRQSRSRFWLIAGLVLGFIVLVIPAGVTLGGAALLYSNAVRDLPAPEQSRSLGLAEGITELYDRTGQTLLLADQSNAAAHWTALETLPSYLLQATLLAEDPDFMETTPPGWLATTVRLWENTLFGPLVPDSSLTGRLVRNAIAPPPEVPTVESIGRETALVAEIERRYSPEQILEWHLNTNDYGSLLYGIEAAAQAYLGKEAASLTLDEAALLAAIPLAPQYNPFDNEIAARGRQADLLRAMRTAGLITKEQFEEASARYTPVLLSGNRAEQIAPEFTAYARRQAQSILDTQGRDGARLVARGGLKIITTLDLDLYYQTECVARAHLARLNGQPTSPDALNGQPCRAAGYLPAVETLGLGTAPDSLSFVLIDVATGEIRTLLGPALRIDNQPGLTLLPFVYFSGFVSGLDNPASMVLDIPRTFPGAVEGLIYTPTNADGRFRGPLNLRDAFSAWLLPPAAQIARVQGMDDVLRYAHRIGLNSLGQDGRYDLSLLERGGSVSVLDMTYAYSVFAGLGDMHGIPSEAVGQGYRQRSPVAVLRIEDSQGNLIWEYSADAVRQNRVGVFLPELGYLINKILADQPRRRAILGDSTALFEFGRENAVISGLTGDRTESWTLGYTPQYVAGVHIRRADDAALALDPLSIQGSGPVWRALMQYAHERDSLPPADWPRPESLVELPVCERSGLLPNDACPTRLEIFLSQPGFQPSQVDTYWRRIEVNIQNGLLATATTPQDVRRARLFFLPPPEAEEWWKANNLELPPTQYDTLTRPELFSAVQILQPQPYAYVGGVVDIRGTLDPSNMDYFRLSYGQGQNPTELFGIGDPQTSYTRGASLGQWDTTALPGGLYNLLLTVVGKDGSAETAAVQVIVDNVPPTITLAAGEPGRVYLWPQENTIVLEAAVSDDYSISRVEFYHSGEFLGADTQAPYGFNWDIDGAGSEVFTAVAFDAVGNQASSTITVEIRRG